MTDYARPAGMEDVNPHEPFPDPAKITVAVVAGGHPFDVPGFHNLFRGMPEIDAYVQHLEDFVADWANVRTRYNVVLFFNYHLDTPPANEKDWWWLGRTKAVLEELGETEQGIVILHHAVSAFPEWEFWSDLVGIPHPERTYTVEQMAAGLSFGELLHMEVADPQHPITKGLQALNLYGETWDYGASSPGPDCHTLLVTDHPKARMKAMAWTRQFRKARLFYLHPGHSNDSYADPTFRTVLSRGIQWVARRL